MNPRRADFDRFVADSSDTLLRTAYLIVGDLGEAEDLVQETLFEVARRWPRIRRMEYPIAYARRILVNRALSGSARRTRRRQELIEAMPAERVAETGGAGEIDSSQDELMDALAALPPRQRAVLVLRYFLDLPEAEVAAALDCSLGTVKSTASRGLARLEQALRPTNDTRSVA
jgi:RNA polymerase sigma-70 factor (sigma-E family)